MSGRRPTVLVTRPEPAAGRLAARLEAGGYRALVSPVMEIVRAESLAPTTLEGAQAVLITSARAAEAASQDLGPDLGSGAVLPGAYCVGDATAAAARKAGFDPVVSASGDATDLLALVLRDLRPEAGRLVILRGRETAYDLAPALETAGFTVDSAILYDAAAITGLRQAASDALVENKVDAVLLLSERTARCFVAAANTIQADLKPVVAVCISEKTAEAARTARFGRVVAAERPDLAATLDALDAILGGRAGRTERLC